MFVIWDNLEDMQLEGTYATVDEANNALGYLIELNTAHTQDLDEGDPGPTFNLSVREV